MAAKEYPLCLLLGMCRSSSSCRDAGRSDCLWLCNRPTLPGPSSRACRLLCSLPPLHCYPLPLRHMQRRILGTFLADLASPLSRLRWCVCVCFFHTSLRFRETTRTAKILVPLSLPLTLFPSLSLSDSRICARVNDSPHSGRLCLTLPPCAPHCANEFVWRRNWVASTAF